MLYQQPQFGPLFIDWSNPISRKLAAAFDPVSGNVYSGTASKKSVSANTSARGVTQQGKTALTSGSAAYIALAGDSIFSANLWTSVSVVSFPSIVTQSAISTVAASPGSAVADRSLYIDASGHLLAFLYDNGSNQQAVDPAVLLANTPYVLAAESNGSTVKAWKNGVNVASTATANGGYTGYSPAPQFVIGYGSGNGLGGTLASNANIALQLWFSPNLSASEHASLAANPWQLFLDPDEDDEALMFAAVGGGSSDTPINPGAGTLAITGYAPSVVQTANQGVSPDAAALTITGYAPSVTQGNTTNIAPDAAALMLTGYAPSIAQTANQSILPGAASLTITGFAPAVAQTDNHAANPGAGALVITGYAPTITQQTASPNLTPGAAALAVVGYAPTITQAPAVGAPRYARPITDVAAGSWQPSVPGASLASMVDEPSADSSDYIYATSPGSCEIALAPVQNPNSITGQVFRYQMWSPFGNGATVRLMCGAAVIAEWVHASLPTVPTIFPQTLSAAQCLSITDYNDLRLVAVAG